MAKAAAKPKMSPQRKAAIAKLDRVEAGLLTAQATIPKLAREVGEVKKMLGPIKDDSSGKDPNAPDK